MQNTKSEENHTYEYLKLIGVPCLSPLTSAFDPGYDPVTTESHLSQSSHLMSSLKLSMACWQVASEQATKYKIEAARRHGVPVCTGGGPFEVAVSLGRLSEYLDLCAYLGVTRIEAGEGFTEIDLNPEEVIRLASSRGLEVQFEVGKKHGGSFSPDMVGELIEQGKSWLGAGAKLIVVEARESAKDVGLFDQDGQFDYRSADRFADAFGLDVAVFEAPDKSSQFAFINHFGPKVRLMNVRLEELLRVEIYRRGLHSDAFQHENLRPQLTQDSEVNLCAAG